MRILFIPPSEADFKVLFNADPLKNGGSISDISFFTPAKRGGGVLSLISRIAKRVFPFLVRSAKPAVKQFGLSMLNDVVSGRRNVKKSLKKRGIAALKQTGRNMIKEMNGSGRNIKKGRIQKKKDVERYKRSVFDLV